MSTNIAIPILADGLHRLGRDALSRCVFFVVTPDDDILSTTPPWPVEMTNLGIPFLLLGLQGVLYQPFVNQPEFRNAAEIDGLFDAIEVLQSAGPISSGPLTVETNILWAPTGWLDLARAANTPADRGDVFRVNLSLFLDLWRFTDNRIGLSELLSRLPGGSLGPEATAPLLRYSPTETEVFMEWARLQFQRTVGGSGQGPRSS